MYYTSVFVASLYLPILCLSAQHIFLSFFYPNFHLKLTYYGTPFVSSLSPFESFFSLSASSVLDVSLYLSHVHVSVHLFVIGARSVVVVVVVDVVVDVVDVVVYVVVVVHGVVSRISDITFSSLKV